MGASWSDRHLFKDTTAEAGKGDVWRKGTQWGNYRKASFWDNTTFAKKHPKLNVPEEDTDKAVSSLREEEDGPIKKAKEQD